MFKCIGGVMVNLDNVTYMAMSNKNPDTLEIHFTSPEVANLAGYSKEEYQRLVDELRLLTR